MQLQSQGTHSQAILLLFEFTETPHSYLALPTTHDISSCFAVGLQSSCGGVCVSPGSGHDAELARQAAHLSSVTEGVAEESKVNRELAALLVERLDSSRK